MSRISGGIEFGYDWEHCARCGSTATRASCPNCGGEGKSHHDCGEDTCCCLHPEDNVLCEECGGRGGSYHCISSPEWCEAHPQPGREDVKSTALNAQAWRDCA